MRILLIKKKEEVLFILQLSKPYSSDGNKISPIR